MTSTVVTSETLADFNAARMGTEAKPEPKEEPMAEELKADAEQEEPKVEPKEEEKPKKGNHKIESRFSELTARARAAEERAAAAEARAAAAEAKTAPKQEEPKKPDAKPSPKEFTDAFEYAEALAKWSADEALRKRDAADAEKAEKTRAENLGKTWQKKIDAAKLVHPDWQEMVASSGTKVGISAPAQESLMESDYGALMAYELAADDELAEKFSQMTPRAQVQWIGRQEAKYESAKDKAAEADPKEEKPEIEKPRPKVPEPIKPVRGSKGADDPINSEGEFKGSFADYKAARMRQMA